MERNERFPRSKEGTNTEIQHLRQGRESGHSYVVEFFLLMRGLTENNVGLVWALSGRVAGPWQLVAWHWTFWLGGPIRLWNGFSFHLCFPAWPGPSPRWMLVEQMDLGQALPSPHRSWLSSTWARDLDDHRGGAHVYFVVSTCEMSPSRGRMT